MKPAIEAILKRIESHKKYNSLNEVQKSRIRIAAVWVHRMVSDSVFKWRRADCIRIAENHKNHVEFNGILLDIIQQY